MTSIWAVILLLGLDVMPSSCGFTLKNNYISIEKDSEFVQLGSQSRYLCSLKREDETIQECHIQTPMGRLWELKNGLLLDENGFEIIGGYQGIDNGNPTKTCGLQINQPSIDDLGIQC